MSKTRRISIQITLAAFILCAVLAQFFFVTVLGDVYELILNERNSYDFSANIRGDRTGGDFYYASEGGMGYFWANNFGQNGLQNVGDLGSMPLDGVPIPFDPLSYTRQGVPVIRGYTYVSLAEKSEEGHVIVFRVISIAEDLANIRIQYIYKSAVPGQESPIASFAFPVLAAYIGVALLAVGVPVSTALVFLRRRKREKPSSYALPKDLQKSVNVDFVATGFYPLDKLLYGGIPVNSAVVLTSPSCDERDALIKSFLVTGGRNSETTFYVTANPNFAMDIAGKSSQDFHLFVCNRQAGEFFSDSPNVTVLGGLDNLTTISIALTKCINGLGPPSTHNRRLCLDLISDAMLFNGTIKTRKWLTELIPEMKMAKFTTLALIDPQMHQTQDLYTILSLFDGEIDIHEKQTRKLQRTLRIARMSNKEYITDETLLT